MCKQTEDNLVRTVDIESDRNILDINTNYKQFRKQKEQNLSILIFVSTHMLSQQNHVEHEEKCLTIVNLLAFKSTGNKIINIIETEGTEPEQ